MKKICEKVASCRAYAFKQEIKAFKAKLKDKDDEPTPVKGQLAEPWLITPLGVN